MQLNAKAREFLRQYHNGLRESYGATDSDRWFSLTDPKETQLRNALMEQSDFLNLITVADVDQLQGQVVPVGSSGLYTGRVLDGRFRKKVGVSLFDNVWQTIKGGFLKSWNWIVGQLNKIPGVDISLANESQPALTANTLSTGGELKGVDKGGISKTISSNSKSVTDNSKKIGEVHFHTKEALSPSQLMEWQELNA